MPPDNNVFYRKYDLDVFEVLQEQIEHYSVLGNIAVIGDLNGRIGLENDFIMQDNLNVFNCNETDLLNYEPDLSSKRTTEDIKTANSFGRQILNLCKFSGIRVCNGRFGKKSETFTFQNKNGCSVIDCLLLSCDSFSIVNDFVIGDFTTFSCHAPLKVVFKLKGLTLNEICTCKTVKHDCYKWNEGFKDDVKRDLAANSDKVNELMNSLSDEPRNIDEIVNNINSCLSGIVNKYTKTEVTKVLKCDYCNSSKRTYKPIHIGQDKPWINDDCKQLYIEYRRSLKQFNQNKCEENRLILNLAKQRFKRSENSLKRRYKKQRGNMLSSMRKKNPKYFYRKFRKRKKAIQSNIKLNDFVTHFKNLVSKEEIDDGPEEESTMKSFMKNWTDLLRSKKLMFVLKN